MLELAANPHTFNRTFTARSFHGSQPLNLLLDCSARVFGAELALAVSCASIRQPKHQVLIIIVVSVLCCSE